MVTQKNSITDYTGWEFTWGVLVLTTMFFGVLSFSKSISQWLGFRGGGSVLVIYLVFLGYFWIIRESVRYREEYEEKLRNLRDKIIAERLSREKEG